MAAAGRVRKLLLWGTALFVIGGTLSLMGLYCMTDGPPPAVDDLRLARRQVPPEENGYLVLAAGKEPIVSTEDEDADPWSIREMEPGGKWDPDLARSIVERNAGALLLLDRCLETAGFQAPEIRDFDALDMQPLMECRALAELGVLRSYLLFDEGKEKASFQNAVKVVLFGHRMEQAQGGLMWWMIGDAIKRLGWTCLGRLVPRTRLEPRELLGCLDDLARCKPEVEGLIDGYKLEYLLFSEAIDRVVSGEKGRETLSLVAKPGPVSWLLGSRLCFSPNRTREMFAASYRRLIEHLRAGPDRSSAPRFEPASPWMPRRNWSGRQLFDGTMSWLPVLVERLDGDNLHWSAARILIALKAFQLDHGKLPEALAELAPAYLGEVPPDPHDGKPLRYSPGRKVIYSVGKDQKDAGGSIAGAALGESFDPDEPTFRIEF